MADNIHSGHRKRLRNRFDKVGFVGWSDHEVLEFLLFSVFRRCDTNALAHRLIDTCGSLGGVFNASQELLMSVDGIGEQAAYYLRTLGAAFAYMNDSIMVSPLPNSAESAAATVSYSVVIMIAPLAWSMPWEMKSTALPLT